PPPPPPPEHSVTSLLRYTESYYKGVLDEDAKQLGVPPTTPAALAAPLVYADEFSGERRMKAERDTFETPHLRLQTSVLKEWASTPTGQRYRYEHMVLRITNKIGKPVAYRVETTVGQPEK